MFSVRGIHSFKEYGNHRTYPAVELELGFVVLSSVCLYHAKLQERVPVS